MRSERGGVKSRVADRGNGQARRANRLPNTDRKSSVAPEEQTAGYTRPPSLRDDEFDVARMVARPVVAGTAMEKAERMG